MVEQNTSDVIYKKWFKTKDKGGFLSISEFADGGKFNIDIGSTSSQGLESHSNAYINIGLLVSFLKAISTNNGHIYNMINKMPESLEIYGGNVKEGQAISRILKISHKAINAEKNEYDKNQFDWRIGHFKARTTNTGAFIPDFKQAPLSLNHIYVTRKEMHQVYVLSEAYMNAILVKKPSLINVIGANEKNE